jgi:hypothetical protein
MDEDVEALVVVMASTYLFEERRGVAPAGSVLEVESGCTLPDGAERRGPFRPAEAPPAATGDGPGALERIRLRTR